MSAPVTTLRSAGLRAARATSDGIRGPWGLPILFAVLAAVGVAESLRLILVGATSEARAGGWYLLLVSMLIAVGALARPDRAATKPPAVPGPDVVAPESSVQAEPERRTHAHKAVIFFVATVAFAWALPWVGFAVANGFFVAAYLIWIDHRRWWHALLIAVVVDACLVTGLRLIDVVLPSGVLGIGI
ncbi:tripartite tricarboxylate transporter TctB family protein [Kribbella sindirgiensis]|uniref:DUF1468 domain-containing protein n=1 Tax=Kribbella sindirgiensis TaxID=1124744 RepID=A0A4R0IJ50_9ACTN|nr:tripartite tricarboxylate transporter TctB family protein [Kribbella sindirgiensis]TCC32210.1 hypothetical protein E0H50_18515 [Kribbella sindirgiensis]